MIRKISAIYSFVIGISIVGMWCMILLTEGTPEGPLEITFHLISEFLMAGLLIASGYILLGLKTYGAKVFMVAHGMLIYSVLNAAGYYGQRGNIGMTSMFIFIFIVSSVLIVLGFIKKENFI
ncbi:MAG: hypothetical protein JL56_15530 [Desulfotomaculum sp. BICA1-6]|nr:MAG: hypothetical protein JL56_15530 [Desulfotomaculum sp. BICA1-6]